LLGDPESGGAGATSASLLLSRKHARDLAGKVKATVAAKHPISIDMPAHSDDGTVNLSCADKQGNLAALTLTHGGGFGAQVTVEGLGITLGHGMSRFNPHPGHPNSPGPGKRPLHNMCPSIVLYEGKPSLAIGGAGGVKIPNSILQVLAQIMARGASMEEAIAGPRLQTTGTPDVGIEANWPREEADYLMNIGFKVQTGPPATVSTVSYDAKTGETRQVMR
jgi:gamma-glutamyltranspeptidase/glutathione hydrolase